MFIQRIILIDYNLVPCQTADSAVLAGALGKSYRRRRRHDNYLFIKNINSLGSVSLTNICVLQRDSPRTDGQLGLECLISSGANITDWDAVVFTSIMEADSLI